MKHYIGIDVAKAQLDVDWLGVPKVFNNNASGVKKLIKALGLLQEKGELSLALCEATGGYEQGLVRACHEEKLPIHVAHPNKVRHFAKARGLLAKTDKLDAKILSDYGRVFEPKADSLLLNASTKKIAELLKRREQLKADKQREYNRLDKLNSKDMTGSVNKHIKWLKKEIQALDKQLSLLKSNEEVKGSHELLCSIPGIGDITAYYLVSNLPELGHLCHKALSSLVGVAPFNRDSGYGQGKRYIQGGRTALRKGLYMAALTASRRNPSLKIFYTRLREKGKPAKLALIAVMRKLLTIANSVIQRQNPWEKNYQNS